MITVAIRKIEMSRNGYWDAISRIVETKDQRRAFDRWNKTLKRNYEKVDWTIKMDAAIVDFVAKNGFKDFDYVFKQLKREPVIVRYFKDLAPQETIDELYGDWRDSEDELLIQTLKKHGPSNLKLIQDKILTRSAEEIKKRIEFLEHQNQIPHYKIGNWTKEEQRIFKDYILSNNPDYSKLQSLMPNRSISDIHQTTVKLRKLPQNLAKSDPFWTPKLKFTWTYNDERLLLKLYQSYGNNWEQFWDIFTNTDVDEVIHRFYLILQRVSKTVTQLKQCLPDENVDQLVYLPHAYDIYCVDQMEFSDEQKLVLKYAKIKQDDPGQFLTLDNSEPKSEKSEPR